MSDNRPPGNWQNPQGGSQQPPQGGPVGQPGPGPHQPQHPGQPTGRPGPQGPQGPQYGQPGPQGPQYSTQGGPTQQYGSQGQQPYAQGHPQQFGPQGPGGAPAKKRSKTPAVIAAVVALALVVGGGFLAVSLLRGSTPAAARGIPGEALAVIELNLNPSAADQLAVKEFVEKFPALADETSDVDGDYKRALWNLIPESEDKPDYAELEPWLGDSVALGVLGSDLSAAEALISVEVTDRGRAEAFAAEHFTGDVVVEFIDDDLMLISPDGAAIDVAAIEDNPLTDNETYAADMDRLGGSWLLTAWGSQELFSQALEETGGEVGINPAALRMHGAMGLRVDDGTAEARFVTASDEGAQTSDADADFVESLPAGGAVALGYAMNDSALDMIWEQLQALEQDQPGMLEMFGITSPDDLGAVLGQQGALTIGWQSQQGPRIGLKVRTDDPGKHQDVLETLLGTLGLAGVQHQSDGDIVHSTFGMSPDELADPADTLGDHEPFTTLIPDADADSLVWVDVPAILAIEELGLEQDPALAENLRVISGIAVSGSVTDDGYTESHLRVGTN